MSVNLDIIEELVHAEFLPTMGTPELPTSLNEWPKDWRDEYEERAAVMEFDG